MPFNRVNLPEVRETLYDRVQEIPWGRVIKHLILPLMLLVFVSGMASGIVEAATGDPESVVLFVLGCAVVIPPVLLAAGLVDRFRRAMSGPGDILSSIGYGVLFTAKVLLIVAWYDLLGIAMAPYDPSLSEFSFGWGLFVFQLAVIMFAVTAVVLHYAKHVSHSIVEMELAMRPSS